MPDLISRVCRSLDSLRQKGAFYVFVGQFLSKFVSFFGSVVIVRLLSKQDYGLLGYFENIYGYFFILAGMGLGNAIVRYVVLAKDASQKRAVFRFCLFSALIFDLLITLLLFFASMAVKFQDGYESGAYLLGVMAFTLPFQDAFLNGCLHERAMFNNKSYALFSASVSMMLIGGKVIGALLFGLSGVVVSQLVIYVVASAVVLVRQRSKYYFAEKYEPLLSAGEKKGIASYSLQYMITNGLWAIFMLNDVLLLGLFGVTPDVLANYKVAYVLPGNLAIISSSIGIVVAPYFIRHENDRSWVKCNFIKVFATSILVVGAVSVLLALFAEPLIALLYGSQYIQVSGLMCIMLISAFINSGVRYTIANLLSAMGKVRFNMVIAWAGVSIQLFLGVVFIPFFSVEGVVYANIAAHSLMAVALMAVFYSQYLSKA